MDLRRPSRLPHPGGIRPRRLRAAIRRAAPRPRRATFSDATRPRIGIGAVVEPRRDAWAEPRLLAAEHEHGRSPVQKPSAHARRGCSALRRRPPSHPEARAPSSSRARARDSTTRTTGRCSMAPALAREHGRRERRRAPPREQQRRSRPPPPRRERSRRRSGGLPPRRGRRAASAGLAEAAQSLVQLELRERAPPRSTRPWRAGARREPAPRAPSRRSTRPARRPPRREVARSARPARVARAPDRRGRTAAAPRAQRLAHGWKPASSSTAAQDDATRRAPLSRGSPGQDGPTERARS